MRTTTFTIVTAATLALTGCKKKAEEAAPAPPSSDPATKVVPKADETPPPAPASKAKSCEELGGTTSSPGRCSLKGPAPFEVTFTGAYEPAPMRSVPGPVFKITSKFDRPVRLQGVNAYAYDKSGAQAEFTVQGAKSKYLQASGSLLEIEPGETKQYVLDATKENMPAELDALQLEVTWWAALDGKDEFQRVIDNMDVRAKDGWK
jgi:hypothetical protein